MQELRAGNGPTYRVGTMSFSQYAREQTEEAADDPRILESENFERYQMYLVHYVAAENACVGDKIPKPFWRDMRHVTITELKEQGMAAIWNR